MQEYETRVTNLRIKKYGKPKNGVLGLVNFVINNQILIHNVKIVQLRDKRILSFPAVRILRSEETSDSIVEHYVYTDIVHPINSEFRSYLEDVIFTTFDSMEGGTISEQNY